MIILGLTGSIGMGKSTTAEMFARLGVPTHDSDKAAHKAFQPDSPVFKAIAKSFPESWDKKTHTIDRKKLGRFLFEHPEKKALLESYVHPYVRDQQKDFIQDMRVKGIRTVLLDIPLLFETGADARVDKVIVVTAPFFIQKQRVMARPNMSVQKFNAILQAQMADREKRERADYIVHTGLGLAFAQRQVRAILRDIQQ